MLVIVDCSKAGFGEERVELDYNSSIEDLITLVTVQNPHLDFDLVQLSFNGSALHRRRKITESGIRDGDTVTLFLQKDQGCCSIL